VVCSAKSLAFAGLRLPSLAAMSKDLIAYVLSFDNGFLACRHHRFKVRQQLSLASVQSGLRLEENSRVQQLVQVVYPLPWGVVLFLCLWLVPMTRLRAFTPASKKSTKDLLRYQG
jgi:hypothetical protein